MYVLYCMMYCTVFIQYVCTACMYVCMYVCTVCMHSVCTTGISRNLCSTVGSCVETMSGQPEHWVPEPTVLQYSEPRLQRPPQQHSNHISNN